MRLLQCREREKESSIWWSLLSHFLSSTCHVRFFASFALVNNHFNLQIIERYCNTFAGIPFITSSLLQSSSFNLQPDTPHIRHLGIALNSFLYNMQSLRYACIFLYFISIGHNIFFFLTVIAWQCVIFQKHFFSNLSNSVKLLLIHSFFVLRLTNFNIVDNLVKLVHPRYKGISTSLFKVSYTCACWKDFDPISRIIFSRWSSISTSTSFVWDTLSLSKYSRCHVHVV